MARGTNGRIFSPGTKTFPPSAFFWRVQLNKKIVSAVGALTLLCSLLAPVGALAARGVVLNFNDVDISTMVKFISELTGKNFVMDDRVKGKISVYSPSKISPEDAFNVFTSVLALKGFTTVPAGKVYKIVPTAVAKQEGMKILSGKEKGAVNDVYVARIIPLKNISSSEAVTLLQPVVSRDGYIASIGPSNMLLAVDSDLNIQKILGILKIVDTSQRREGAEILFLKYATADNAANVIREWIGAKEKGAAISGQSVSVPSGALIVPDTRLNALIIFGGEKDKEDIKKLIAMVDIPSPTSSSKINVYYLENADATDAAKVLESVVKGSAAATPTGTQPGAAAQQSAFEDSKITITPDKATNSLVIMASPADYQNLIQVIKKLDKRRRQVFVQAVIAEISLDKLKDFGTQLGVAGGAVHGDVATAGVFDPFNILSQSTPQQAAIISALGSLGSVRIGANFNALFTNGTINVLSTPTIMTSDNKEAEIFVGENVPLVTQTSSTSIAVQTSVERKDVGIDLKITPQITEGDYLKLDIYQEISAVTANKGQATDLVTTKRSAKTSVVIKDKDTVVIGGLIQDQDNETVNKIPILGDIPLLGWLFKTKSTERNKTNLIILLTPRIIKSARDMAEVSEQQKNSFSKAVHSDKPFNLDRELKTSPQEVKRP
jgi:general secretion pathway protein D